METKNEGSIWGGAALLIGALALVLIGIAADKVEGPSEFEAVYACEQFVRQRLKSPSTAEFPTEGRIISRVRETPPTFSITGYVDAQNAFGAALRTVYSCTAKSVSDGWVEESLLIED